MNSDARVPSVSASTTTAARLAVVIAAALAPSCGGSHSPAAATTPTTTATPATAAGTSVGPSCQLGNGSAAASCEKKSGTPRLLSFVETAIDTVVREKPQLFDLKDTAAPGTTLYRVLDTDGYLDGIVDALRRQGACAERDPADPWYERILVKDSNDYSESYDVLLSSGYLRRGDGAFLETCTPASFPLDRSALDLPPAGSGCGRPYPPPVTRFNCKVHLPGIEYYTLDSTPIVGPDVEYCAAIGYTDGRSLCPIRQEGAPDRAACEAWRVGSAKDTARPGPTWTVADTGAYCTGLDMGCQNSPDNQFQLRVAKSGQYRVSAANGVSCTVDFRW
jgi:hypothetical protein